MVNYVLLLWYSLSVCLFVTLVHSVVAVKETEMPFDDKGGSVMSFH